MSGCRIGKVRFKNGTELRIIPRTIDTETVTITAEMRRWLSTCIKDLPQIVGFAAIAWTKDQTHTISDWYGEHSHVDRNLGPTYVAEALRRRNARRDLDAIING